MIAPTGRLHTPPVLTKSATLLPHKDAVHQLMTGTPEQRSFQSYAKLTPSGANQPTSYQDIIDMAKMGTAIND